MADPLTEPTDVAATQIVEPLLDPEAVPLPDSDDESDADVDSDDDAAPIPAQALKRSSIEKRPIIVHDDDEEEPEIVQGGEKGIKSRITAFEKLPDEIIQQILQLTDPNSFASLVVLNSKWRSVSQQTDLYATQLSQCPSYAASHTKPPVAKDDDLSELRRLFAQEVKRNLFAAYLRPNKTVIKVISNSISSSSCPGGEGLQFSPSPRGHHLLAYNSSRIHIIDVRGTEIAVTREFKILRRPVAIAIKDDGSLLAVLLTEMQVDLYDLTASPPRRSQSIILDHSPRAIALSPDGSVLAAAYEGGIEVTSLNPGALPTERRAVKCDGVDALAFSFDGTQILGTTVHSNQPNTVILTAPYYDPGSHSPDDTISALWTTSILFPNSSRDCSHAVLLQNTSREEASWTFTYDSSFETFRAVSIDDLRNGTTYFTGPIPSRRSAARLLPCTLPAASYHGDLVSAGFQGADIWVYGVPEDLDAPVNPNLAGAAIEGGSGASTNGLHRRPSGTPQRSNSRAHEPPSDDDTVPQWQLLCDKLRNTFVSGAKVAELSGVNTVRWVEGFGETSLKERLIVAARGISPARPITEDEGFDFVDGGRLTLVDFDYGITDGQVCEIEIEVGTKEPEVLEEETRDLATEVAIVRRRTVAQRMGSRGNMMRSAPSAANAPRHSQMPPMPPLPNQVSALQPSDDEDDDPLLPRRMGAAPATRREPSPQEEEAEDGEPTIEEQEALDQPYAHASPRSAPTLRRAATAAAMNRHLRGPAPAAGRHNIQYRRADGRAEHPHESDADNWVPPPPPYQKEDPEDLPAFLRHKVAPASSGNRDTNSGLSQPQPARSTGMQPQPPRSHTAAPIPSLASPVRHPMMPRTVTQQPFSHHRLSSGPAALLERPRSSGTMISHMTGAGSIRPSSSPSMFEQARAPPSEEDDIYDVSPPASPGLGPVSTVSPPQDVSGNIGIARPAPSPMAPSAVSTPSIDSASLAASRHDDSPRSRLQPNMAVNRDPSPRLSLAIPSPQIATAATFSHSDASPMMGASATRRLSNSQTWPRQPPPSQPAAARTSAIMPTGYPYSAPAASAPGGMSTETYPPQPAMPSQYYSAGPRQPGPGFTGPASSASGMSIPRVPVGSRESWRYSSQADHQLPSPSRHPLQQHPMIAQPQPQRPHTERPLPPPPPVEDQPLIISTPKGVSGAFDDPQVAGSHSQMQVRAETPIIAPVPRHPRVNERASVLQPPAPERVVPPQATPNLIPSMVAQGTPRMAPNMVAQGTPHMSPHMMAAQGTPRMPPAMIPQGTPNMHTHPGFNPTGAPLDFLAAPPQPANHRSSSLSRRQSRAERSAAKNISDAKKKGWRRSRSLRKKRQSQMFGDDPAAWTDVAGSDATGYHEHAAGGKSKKKCVVM